MDGLYDDLPFGETVWQLKEEKQLLQRQLKERENHLKKVENKIRTLEKEKKTLEKNISSLYKTAVTEIERKDKTIDELHREKDDLILRRRRGRKRRCDVDSSSDTNLNVADRLQDKEDHECPQKFIPLIPEVDVKPVITQSSDLQTIQNFVPYTREVDVEPVFTHSSDLQNIREFIPFTPEVDVKPVITQSSDLQTIRKCISFTPEVDVKPIITQSSYVQTIQNLLLGPLGSEHQGRKFSNRKSEKSQSSEGKKENLIPERREKSCYSEGRHGERSIDVQNRGRSLLSESEHEETSAYSNFCSQTDSGFSDTQRLSFSRYASSGTHDERSEEAKRLRVKFYNDCSSRYDYGEVNQGSDTSRQSLDAHKFNMSTEEQYIRFNRCSSPEQLTYYRSRKRYFDR